MNSHKIGSSQIIDFALTIVAYALTYMTVFYIYIVLYFFIWERIVAVYEWCVKINLLNGIWKEMVVSLDLTLNRISCEVPSG